MITKNEFMEIAIEEAYSGSIAGDGGPFGAVIENGGKILSVSHNTVLKDNDPTKHAEMKAISLAAKKMGKYDLSGCTIYSTTEPCPMCFSAIHWACISKIVYGTGIEDVKALGFNELTISVLDMKRDGDSPVEIEGGFMLSECKDLLKKWENIPDRQTY